MTRIFSHIGACPDSYKRWRNNPETKPVEGPADERLSYKWRLCFPFIMSQMPGLRSSFLPAQTRKLRVPDNLSRPQEFSAWVQYRFNINIKCSSMLCAQVRLQGMLFSLCNSRVSHLGFREIILHSFHRSIRHICKSAFSFFFHFSLLWWTEAADINLHNR